MRLYEFDAKAQAKKDFEDVLFGELKDDPERDTNIEGEIFDTIYDFIEDPTKNNKEQALRSLTYLSKFKDIFPDDLVPDTKEVYRGTIMRPRTIIKNFLSTKYVNRDSNNYFEFPYVYEAKSPIQSWSTKYSTSSGFSKITPLEIPVVIIAKVDDSFIMNSNVTNLISDLLHSSIEDEIIRISNSPLNCIVSFNKKYMNELDYDNRSDAFKQHYIKITK